MRSTMSRRSFSPLKALLLVVVVLVVGATATIATMWAMGIPLPFANRKVAEVPEGIPIPVSTRSIPAYTKITREDFVNPKTGKPVFVYLPAELVVRDRLLTKEQLLGRVLNHDKEPLFTFNEEEFFEESVDPKTGKKVGPRQGLVAGIPPSKRAIVLPAEKIEGIQNLRIGDHFDLLATMPVDFEKMLSRMHASGPNSPLLAAQSPENLPKRATVEVLIQDGSVVLPVRTREVLVSSGSRAQGVPPQTKPVQEITIAVDPKEVPRLTEALAVKAEIICVARSGQPADPGPASVTPGSAPTPNIETVEIITGGKRQFWVSPGPGQSPQEQTNSYPAGEATPLPTAPAPVTTSPTPAITNPGPNNSSPSSVPLVQTNSLNRPFPPR